MADEFVIIEAQTGDTAIKADNPKVVGLAYSGGKITLPGWKAPVVVDLAGLTLPETVPLLVNHENRTASKVGQVTARVENNSLSIDGKITATTGTATGIVEQAKSGGEWQLSIGAEVQNAEFVKTGSRNINGREIEAPFYHIKASTLREVSVVAVGADVSTKLSVAAMFNFTGNLPVADEKDKTMGKENAQNIQAERSVAENIPPQDKTPVTVQAKADGMSAEEAIQKERDRVIAISDLSRGEFPKIEAQAITEGWTLEQAAKAMKQERLAAMPQANIGITVNTQPEGPKMRACLEAALALRAGISGDDLQAEFGNEVIDHADKRRTITLMDLMKECVRLEGRTGIYQGENTLIEAAFSTVSLPGILSNVAGKKMLKAFMAQPLVAPRLCSVGDLNDFKETERFRLTDVGDLEPVAADGEIKDGAVREDKATNQIDTYGKKFVLTRKMSINDDLGAFLKHPASMGNRAARLIDQLFFARLLSNPTQGDGKKLFHNAHKNLLTGADSALSHDALAAATAMFLEQIDADGQPISVEPRYLLVPTGLKYDAIRLTKGAQLIVAATPDSGPSLVPALNALTEENLTVISSPYLTNSKYTGNSASAWYLFGNPAQVDTFELGYLRGKRTPTIEKGNTDFNTLGMWFRVIFDIGVREQDHRGMLKSDGE